MGSHCAKALAAAGHEDIIFDSLLFGHQDFVRWGALIKGDIRDGAALDGVLAAYRIDAVMHFAALAYVGESVMAPGRYYDVNVHGTRTLLDAMVRAGVLKIVFSSSCAVYDSPDRIPISESAPTNPINPYGFTKMVCERMMDDFGRAHGLKSARLRYFNAAGADPEGELGEDHSPEIHVIPRAFDAASGGPPLEIFGEDYPTPDGTCLRDYIHVTDLADAHVRALARLEGGGPSASYNVGTECPSSVRQVIEAVERVTGRTVARRSAARRPGDPAVLYASARRIRDDLGWTPQRPELTTIVADAWKWHSARPRGFAGTPVA